MRKIRFRSSFNVGPPFYGVVVFIRKSLNHKVRHNLSKWNDIIETLPFEVVDQKKKICIISGIYQSPDSDEKQFKKEHENLGKKDSVSSKQLFIIGDMSINSRDYETNNIVEKFYRDQH